jgi:three-Cys-motif partner protein
VPSDPPVQEIKAWSKDKLELLGKYLAAYSTIMAAKRVDGKPTKGRWLQRYAYVDAFANVGGYVDPESREFVNGSPLVALNTEPCFDEYVFIERSPVRVAQLQERLRHQPRYSSCRVIPGDSNRVLVDDICQRYRYDTYSRALVFLDPYGFEVEWATVERLADTRAIDIFVNFPIMPINRVLGRKREPDPDHVAFVRRIMGWDDWVAEAYRVERDLFGELRYSRERFDANWLVGLYVDQLRRHFRYVSEAVIMRNSINTPLYALFLASHQEVAVKITNDVMRKHKLERLA